MAFGFMLITLFIKLSLKFKNQIKSSYKVFKDKFLFSISQMLQASVISRGGVHQLRWIFVEKIWAFAEKRRS